MNRSKHTDTSKQAKHSRRAPPFTIQSPPARSPEKHPDLDPEELEATDEKDMADDGDSLDASDPNFQSELAYDGYRSIEEYDNDAFSGRDVERDDDADEDLIIEDREEDPGLGEEDPKDPQENHRA